MHLFRQRINGLDLQNDRNLEIPTSLDFFCVRAINAMQCNVPQEVLTEHLIKINGIVSDTVSDRKKTCCKIKKLVDCSLYSELTDFIDLQTVTIHLFDQVILLFKRLIVVISSLGSELSAASKKSISVTLQLFLAEFNYMPLPSIQRLFLETFLQSLINVYIQDILFLDSWFVLEMFLYNEETTLQMEKRNQLPMYSVVENFIFSKNTDKWSVYEEFLLGLVALSNKSKKMEIWLYKSLALIDNLLLMSTLLPPTSYPTLDKFFDLILKLIFLTKNLEIKEAYTARFQENICSRLSQTLEGDASTSTFAFSLLVWILRLVQEFAPIFADPTLLTYFLKACREDQVMEMMTAIYTTGNQKVLILAVVKSLIESKVEPILLTLFCDELNSDEVVHDVNVTMLNDLRIKAMRASKGQEEYAVRRIQEIAVSQVGSSVPLSKLGSLDFSKLLPRIIKHALRNFFYNSLEVNRIVVSIVLTLINFRASGIINAFIGRTNHEGCSELYKIIMEYLYEQFLLYEAGISKENEEKYNTMSSKITFERNSQLFPKREVENSGFDELNLSEEESSVPVDLTANMHEFRRLILDLYLISKFNQRISL